MGKPTSRSVAVRSFEQDLLRTCQSSKFTRYGLASIVNDITRLSRRVELTLTTKITNMIRLQLNNLLEIALLGGEPADALEPFYKETQVYVTWRAEKEYCNSIVIGFKIADTVYITVNVSAVSSDEKSATDQHPVNIFISDLLTTTRLTQQTQEGWVWQTLYSYTGKDMPSKPKCISLTKILKKVPDISYELCIYIQHLINNIIIPFSNYPTSHMNV